MRQSSKMNLILMLVLALFLVIGFGNGISTAWRWYAPDPEYRDLVGSAMAKMGALYDEMGICYTSDEISKVSLYGCVTRYYPDMVKVASEVDSYAAFEIQGGLDTLTDIYEDLKIHAMYWTIGMIVAAIVLFTQAKQFVSERREVIEAIKARKAVEELWDEN